MLPIHCQISNLDKAESVDVNARPPSLSTATIGDSTDETSPGWPSKECTPSRSDMYENTSDQDKTCVIYAAPGNVPVSGISRRWKRPLQAQHQHEQPLHAKLSRLFTAQAYLFECPSADLVSDDALIQHLASEVSAIRVSLQQ